MQTRFFSRSLPVLLVLMLIAIIVSRNPNTQNSFASPSHATQAQDLIQRYSQSVLPLRERTITAFTSVTKDDCWIAGTYLDEQNQTQMFFQHFKNGKWSLVPAPSVRGPASIHNIAAISARDIWAIGNSTTDDFYQGYTAPSPLIEHWDGQRWSIFDTPTSLRGTLNAVTILSTKNIWITGSSFSSGFDHHYGYVTHSRAFFMHFNGLNWEQVISPDTQQGASLTGISASRPDDVWAVGTTRIEYSNFPEGYSALIEHFDGEKWNVIPSMNLGTDQYAYNTNNTSLSAISAINSRDIWAVGEVAEHWDGTRWSIVSFLPQNYPTSLTTIITLGSKDVWAGNEGAFYHWNGFFWKPVPLSPSISQLQNWQRFGKTNTLIGLGTYHDQIYIMTLN